MKASRKAITGLDGRVMTMMPTAVRAAKPALKAEAANIDAHAPRPCPPPMGIPLSFSFAELRLLLRGGPPNTSLGILEKKRLQDHVRAGPVTPAPHADRGAASSMWGGRPADRAGQRHRRPARPLASPPARRRW